MPELVEHGGLSIGVEPHAPVGPGRFEGVARRCRLRAGFGRCQRRSTGLGVGPVHDEVGADNDYDDSHYNYDHGTNDHYDSSVTDDDYDSATTDLGAAGISQLVGLRSGRDADAAIDCHFRDWDIHGASADLCG